MNGEAILMSTHNIGFFGRFDKKLSLNYDPISSNTHIISSAVNDHMTVHIKDTSVRTSVQ